MSSRQDFDWGKIIIFLKKKIFLLIFFVILLAISVSHLYRYFVLGSDYTLLLTEGPDSNWEETYAYATLVNRVKQDQNINDAYVYEYSNKPSPFLSEAAPALLLGNLAKIFSVSAAFVIA